MSGCGLETAAFTGTYLGHSKLLKLNGNGNAHGTGCTPDGSAVDRTFSFRPPRVVFQGVSFVHNPCALEIPSAFAQDACLMSFPPIRVCVPWIVIVFALVVAGCGEGDPGNAVPGNGFKAAQASGCGTLPKTQGLSQPCCPDYKLDACGATLFCAAFDGRKTFSCYPENSRGLQQACFENRHCASNICSTTTKTCLAGLHQYCNAAEDCAPDDKKIVYCSYNTCGSYSR